MSYILDALKKAAEQRGANATVLLRPSMPLPHGGRLRLPWIVVGALLLLNVVGLAYLMWPTPQGQTAIPPVPPAKVALIQPIEAPPPPPPTHVIPAEPPKPAAPARTSAGPPRAPASVKATEPAVKGTEPSAKAPAMPVNPPAAPAVAPPAATAIAPPARPTVEKPVGDKAVVRITPEPRATTRPTEPRTAAAAPAKADGQRFKLEVLSYSDVPAQRLVFINGRRYREGDTIDGGAVKVEAIREDSVLLSEEGQRFTLR
jgi:hypothetical protein